MKKLALIVIIAALSTLMAAAKTTASDERFDWWVLQGTYEMIATGSCLHSTEGFIEDPAGPPFIPIPKTGSTVWGATTMAVATWVLYYDGTGYIAGINYPIDFPPGSPGPAGGPAWGPRARQGGFNYDIKYHASGNDITFEVFLPASINPHREQYAVKIGEWEGSVSLAKQTITIPTVNQKIDFTTNPQTAALYFAVCNTARVLIRVGLAPKKR